MLYSLGLSKQDIVELLGVNYGFAYNIWKAWKNSQDGANSNEMPRLTNFNFNGIKFGVEIEAYGLKRELIISELQAVNINIASEDYNHTTRDWWKLVRDSSIIGDDSFEVVSPILEGEEGLQKLRTVLLIISGLEAKVNKSCGLHVHIDAREFDAQTWKRLFKNYQMMERLIDKWMPESRRGDNNSFCKSIRSFNFDTIRTTVEDVTNTYKYMFDSCRYYKVNIMSFWRHGSVEFRQHAGTTNYKKVMNWVKFLARLVEFSKIGELQEGTYEEAQRFMDSELINFYKEREIELN